MPGLLVYTNPIKPGICQVPVFSVGDPTAWTLQFNNGNGLYDPNAGSAGAVGMNLGYVNGLENISYPNAFQWVDTLNNRYTGSFAIAAGVPGSLSWDDPPIGVQGSNGAWLLRGRSSIPGVSGGSSIRKVYIDAPGAGYASVPSVDISSGSSNPATATAVLTGQDSGVASVSVTNPGSNYTSAPAVVFTPVSGGTGAAATAIMANGLIVFIIVTNPGTGYLLPPTVSFTGGGGGSAAAATAALFSNMITSVVITNPGTGYTSAPAVALSGGNGTGAVLAAQIVNGSIASIQIATPGSGYGQGNTYQLSFSGGGGTGASATVTADTGAGTYPGKLTTVNLISGGSGYTSAPTITIVAVAGTAGAGTAVVSGGTIQYITVTNAGSGYTNPPIITFTGGVGAGGASAHAVVSGGVLAAIVIDVGGAYSVAPTVVVTNSLGSGGTLVPVINFSGMGCLTSIAINTNGYTSQPTVVIAGGGGSGAQATACMNAAGTAVSSIVVTNPGSGYSYPPGVTTTGGTGSPTGVCTATISAGSIATLVVAAGGSGYPLNTNIPLIFTGTSQSPATGYATTDSTGRVISATLTNSGTYYSALPTVSLGGSGSGASILAVIGYSVASIAIVAAGGGFNPGVTYPLTFTGPAIVPASGTATMDGSGAVTSVHLTNAGVYTAPPTVSLSPNFPGDGAVFSLVCTGGFAFGSVASITIVNPGTGYYGGQTISFSGGGGSSAAATAIANQTSISSIVVGSQGSGYSTLPPVNITPNLGTQAEAAGAPSASFPYIRNPITLEVLKSVQSIPYLDYNYSSTQGVYNDALLLIRPKILLTPTLTLQGDGVTYAATFDPSSLAFVQAVLRFRRSVTVDMHIYGGGRLLFIGSLTIMNSLEVTP